MRAGISLDFTNLATSGLNVKLLANYAMKRWTRVRSNNGLNWWWYRWSLDVLVGFWWKLMAVGGFSLAYDRRLNMMWRVSFDGHMGSNRVRF